jgi:nucleoside-diphosphate-sugar epimerase
MQPVVLVTGGTGVVGTSLLPHLAAAYPNHQAIVVTRGAATAHSITADLQIGFAAPDLHERVTTIVHCAADTRFNLSIQEARALNVQGTRHLLDFALRCPRLEQFAHVSTLYIAGRRPGIVTETPLHHANGYCNTYEQSKHEAEELVLGYSDRLPVSIYRLSSVVGKPDRRSHFHQVIRLIPWSSQFPVLPGVAGVPVDLIAAEWAGQALAFLIRQPWVAGRIAHICAGSQRSLTVEHLIELAFSTYELGAGVQAPRPCLSGNGALPHAASPTTQGRALAALHTFLPHLAIHQPFDPGKAGVLLESNGLAPPSAKEFLSRALDLEFSSIRLRNRGM